MHVQEIRSTAYMYIEHKMALGPNHGNENQELIFNHGCEL